MILHAVEHAAEIDAHNAFEILIANVCGVCERLLEACVYLAATDTIVGALIGQLLLVVGAVGLYGGACFVAAPKFFPTPFRTTGQVISYQVTVAVFGGTTPLIGTLLVHAFGSPLAPAYYVAVVAIACLIMTQFVPGTKGASLRTATGLASDERATGAVHKAR